MNGDWAILLSDLLQDEGFLSGAGPEYIEEGAAVSSDSCFLPEAGLGNIEEGATVSSGSCFFPKTGLGNIVDCRDVEESRLYCSAEACQKLRSRLSTVPLHALHWIDSGDFHYLSVFFLERIEEPFELLLFDHHPDDQPLAFESEDMLSCGSWVGYCRRSLPLMKSQCSLGPGSAGTAPGFVGPAPGIIGPSTGSAGTAPGTTGPSLGFAVTALGTKGPGSVFAGTAPGTTGPSPVFAGTDLVFAGPGPGTKGPGSDTTDPSPGSLPLYLSLDLDILSPSVFATDWDQGTMGESALLDALTSLTRGRRVLGIDVCGGLSRSQGATDSQLAMNASLRMRLRESLLRMILQ
ncbi:MAG: hypothetical protein SOZ66_03735 [Candidatus Cryptobacteroides sp.]|nr:hypothetical protein [Candidatus Cryptobacteroides sp.]